MFVFGTVVDIAVADLIEGLGGLQTLPLFLVKKKKRIAEGRKAGRAKRQKPGPLLSSRSGSAT